MNSKILLLILVLVISNCSSTKPAEPGIGPGFESFEPPLTADLLFDIFTSSTETYPLSSDENCPSGGTVSIDYDFGINSISSKITFHDCGFDLDESVGLPEPVSLVANGTFEFNVTNVSSEEEEATQVIQHISFSGDMGFAANCDYTFEGLVDRQVEGDCTYLDSTGLELTMTSEYILDALNE